MEKEFDYPLNMTKKQALTRRANKLIEWLHRDEYAVYVDDSSIENLRKLIKLIIAALEETIPSGDWRPFLLMFQDARKILIVDEDGDQAKAYTETIESLISSMESYRGFVGDME